MVDSRVQVPHEAVSHLECLQTSVTSMCLHRAVRRTLDLRSAPGTVLQSRKEAGWRMRRPLVARASLGRGRCPQTPDLCQGKPVQAPSAARSRVVFLTSAAFDKEDWCGRVEGYAGQCLGAYARSLLMCRPDNLLIACLRPTPRFARVMEAPDDCRRIAEAPAALFSLAEAEATLEPGEPQGHRGLPPRARALRKRCQVSAHPPRLTTTLASTYQHLTGPRACMNQAGFTPSAQHVHLMVLWPCDVRSALTVKDRRH